VTDDPTPGVEGKRALFSGAAGRVAGSSPDNDQAGRHAVFSAPARVPGAVIVECERCEGRTPVPLGEMPRKLLVSLWMPLRRHSRLMRCPACGQLSWCRVDWLAARQSGG